jgi:iron complex outermembrane receptor protein
VRIALATVLLNAIYFQLSAQEIVRDTTLKEVVINAYTAGRPLNEVPASIGYVSSADLGRFNNTSILPAANSIPGVRMEERSPGSYRLSIRGSLLRSPFGVRNVKMYWNGLPFTDGGGNTYLNLLDFNSVGTMEVIKGPGGSLYGAGTGGVVLVKSPEVKQNEIEQTILLGSFGLRRVNTAAQFRNKNLVFRINAASQQSDGYRQQSAMKRDGLNADLKFLLSSRSTLSATFFYTNLQYQTPGGLNKVQYDQNAKQARPAGGPNRGAVEQKAEVSNKTPYAGLVYDYDWSDRWTTRIGIFASHSKFDNPTIRNYEQRRETNTGARTETQFKFGTDAKGGKLTFGAEYQHLKSPIGVYGNSLGVKDTVQTFDNLTSTLFLGFAQVDFEFGNSIFLTIGGSINNLSYTFERTQPAILSQAKKFSGIFSPRVAILKKISENISVFGNLSRGFSPPSLAEVRPSTNTFSDSLDAETGTNYELGFRGNAGQRISFDLAVYDFHLDRAIVIQHKNNGAEYFINAGKTRQQGIEAKISWSPISHGSGVVSDLKLWNSYSFNHYRFRNYISDGADYGGKKLTGVPPTVNITGLDVTLRGKIYMNATANYVDHTPLNDANTFFANEYFLVGARLGLKTQINRSTANFFAGVDNALDRKYSLGNDLNAIGNRFYNVAPARNFYAGITVVIH